MSNRKELRELLKTFNASEHPYDSDQFMISIQDMDQLLFNIMEACACLCEEQASEFHALANSQAEHGAETCATKIRNYRDYEDEDEE